MPRKEVQNLLDRDYMEYVAYYAWMAGFNNLSKTFWTLLHYILLKHCGGCNTICNIIQNLKLHKIWNFLIKDTRFISHITNSAWNLVQAEMKSVTSSNQLRLPIEKMNPWWLREFSFVAIDRAHKQEVFFTHTFLRACIDSDNHIIDDPKLDLVDNIFLLRNNMVDSRELEERNSSKQKKALISVVNRALLCYSWNERSNIF